jgi:hypothetical protein
MPIQIYYINGGSSLTLGATIVYQSGDSKEKYVTPVTELIGTMTYSDESLKAISTIEMYSTIFGTYKGVFEHTTTNQTPTEQNPNNPSTEEPQSPSAPPAAPPQGVAGATTE